MQSPADALQSLAIGRTIQTIRPAGYQRTQPLNLQQTEFSLTHSRSRIGGQQLSRA